MHKCSAVKVLFLLVSRMHISFSASFKHDIFLDPLSDYCLCNVSGESHNVAKLTIATRSMIAGELLEVSVADVLLICCLISPFRRKGVLWLFAIFQTLSEIK